MALTTSDAISAAKRRSMYWRGQVFPRLGTLFGSLAFCAPVLVGLVLPPLLQAFATISTPISDVAGTGMNYAAIGFGACVTGAVLAISLPGPDRVSTWVKSEGQVDGFSAYSDLVFALTWAALAQLAVIVVCVSALIVGGDVELLPRAPRVTHVVLLSLSTAVFFYAITQLFVLVQTISQLGNLIDFQERRNAQTRNGPPRP